MSCISKNLPYSKIVVTHYLSLSSSLVLPNIVAEPGVKAYLLKKYDVPISESIASVIIDKIFVLAGLFLLTLLVLPMIFILYPQAAVWFPAYLLLIVFMVLMTIALKLGILKKFSLPQWFVSRTSRITSKLSLLDPLFHNKGVIFQGLLLSFFSQFLAICAVYILALTMEPGLLFYQCLLLMPPVMLATAMPVAFNGWGIRELAMIYMLGFVSISTEAALALSVQFGTIGLLLWSIGLVFWIPVKRKKHENA